MSTALTPPRTPLDAAPGGWVRARRLLAPLSFVLLVIPGTLAFLALAAWEKVRHGHISRVERGTAAFLSRGYVGAMMVLLLPVTLLVAVVAPIEKARYGQLGPVGKVAGLGLVLSGLLAAPAFLGEYLTFQVGQCAIFAVILLGLNVLVGYTGQISLGHGAFALVGAYVTGILLTYYAESTLTVLPLLCVGAGALAAAVLGVLVGIPSLRLSGPYLGLVTLSLAVSMPILLKSRYLSDWTMGTSGLVVLQPEAPLWAERLSGEQWRYYLVLVPSLVLIALATNVLRSRTGRLFEAVRDSEVGAQMAGVNVARTKLLAFGVSALYAGAGGGLMVLTMGFVSPDTFTLFDSINLLTAVVVGGLGRVLGALMGGIFLGFQSDLNAILAGLVPHGDDLRWALYGLLVIVIILYSPGGIAGKLYRKF